MVSRREFNVRARLVQSRAMVEPQAKVYEAVKTHSTNHQETIATMVPNPSFSPLVLSEPHC